MHDALDRSTLLARIRARVGEDHAAGHSGEPLVFCTRCGAEGVTTHTTAAAERYRCPACAHEDDIAIRFDGKIRYDFREGDGELVHQTVGALCERDDHVLLFLRRRYPYAYTVPAGHLEVGEDPAESVAREVTEETGLTVTRTELLVDGEALGYRCSRGAGVHAWRLYACETAGDPRLSDEGRIIGWYDRAEIARLERDGRLTPPTALFLQRLGWTEARS